MSKDRVGLIGAGLMGHGMGKNILLKGFPLTVLAHRNRAPVEDLVAKGAKEVKSAKEVAAESDIIILCVTGSPQVHDVIHRQDGVLAGLRKGSVIADCSTAEPSATLKIAEAVQAAGADFADTPLSRTPKEAEEGKLAIMAGGDEKVLARIRPVLEAFADTIIHAGPLGAGHTVKLINNYIGLGTAAVAAEAITAALKAGVDMTALKDIIMSGGGRSVMFERLIKVPLEDDDSAAKFAIANATKDLRYYTNMTENLPMTSFIAEAVHQSYVLAINRGYKDRFVPRMIDMLCELNGVKK